MDLVSKPDNRKLWKSSQKNPTQLGRGARGCNEGEGSWAKVPAAANGSVEGTAGLGCPRLQGARSRQVSNLQVKSSTQSEGQIE